MGNARFIYLDVSHGQMTIGAGPTAQLVGRKALMIVYMDFGGWLADWLAG